MKNSFRNIAAILLILIFSVQVNSQVNRTIDTKVVDILAQFPTRDLSHSDKLMKEILDMGEMGILKFCDKIIPPGTGNDRKARYALESLARYSGAPDRDTAKKLTEKAILTALEKETDKEVKAFFIHRLFYCGSDQSAEILGKYLADAKLYSHAAMVLTAIGTEKAGQVLLDNLSNLKGEAQIHGVKALGVIKYKPAENALLTLTNNSTSELKRQTLYALANTGLPSSEKAIVKAVEDVGHKADGTEAMVAYLHYANQLAKNGNKELSNKLGMALLKKSKAPDQLHFRSATMKILSQNKGNAANALLIKEFNNPDKAYRGALLKYAAQGMTSAEVAQWIKAMKKAPVEAKIQIISALAKREESRVLQEVILPSLVDKSVEVRIEAINSLAANQKKKAIPVLLERLSLATTPEETFAIKAALLGTCGVDECRILSERMKTATDSEKVVLIEVIGARRATDYFNLVMDQTQSDNKQVISAAYLALQNLAKSNDLNALLVLLNKTNNETDISATQKAIIAALENNNIKGGSDLIVKAYHQNGNDPKLLPVFPYINDPRAIEIVAAIIDKKNPKEEQAALEALINWKSTESIPLLFKLITSESNHTKAFNAYLKQVMDADFPDDQKLLLVRKLMPVATRVEEKRMVINAAGNIKTFLTLAFISEYIDIPELSAVASNAAMKIFLPSPGGEDGLTGDFVRAVAEKVREKLTGPDSQYSKIDITDYLDKMPQEKGYVFIFNGNDLTGWQGLVKNPIARSKMSAKELAAEQIKANEKMHENWSVKDGSIMFNGKGANLCTVKKFGDFEMLVDWKITRGGDSGIYLRGTPQVQIWATSRVEVGAQVGSGGLYNNKIHPSKPLVVADNPVGEWNTFRIRMVGEKVTVYLNGTLVVDNVTLENYWDRSMPIFPVEQLELQAHGSDLEFRNIYVREINGGNNELSEVEKSEGFTSLFDGKNLDHWIGNKTDYLVEDGMIKVRPKQGGHGNLYTANEYSDFILRFEFQLTPGANNGLGIHTPLEGDAAYAGKELQILDDTAPVYANLKPYQYHGSVYGIVPSKKGSLKPVGEWNYQEVKVKGDDIKIILNGNVIVDANLAEATKNGTADGKDHPGLKRHKGHIAFLGHGSELQFRNIRIKDLTLVN